MKHLNSVIFGIIAILLLLIFFKLQHIENLQVDYITRMFMREYISAKEIENGEHSNGFAGQVSSGTASKGE